jgi:hypothetical protein
MRKKGHVIAEYVMDGATSFTSSEFTEELKEFRQHQLIAAPGAHHHNGPAERCIGTLMALAQMMMLHTAIHWPEVSDPKLWPMAVQHAMFLYNHMLKKGTGLAPIELLSCSHWSTHHAQHLHVWGSPVYVLDPTLQDGQKIPKWKP